MSRFASAPWLVRAAYIGALVAVAATLLGFLATMIALAGLGRLSSKVDLVAVPGWFWYFRADSLVRRWLGIGSIFAVGLAGLLAIGSAKFLRPPLHGAARWASEAELVRQGLRSRQGIVLGRRSGRLLVFGGEEHVMLHAPTRSGKGVGVVIPNLLTWPDSVVVLDVKRENWEATAGYRARHGQQVILFDPLDSEGRSARYNPLGHIDRTDPVVVLDELQRISVMLFPSPMTTDPFWAEAARTGFIGVGALVAETPDLPFSLGSIYGELTEGDPRTRLPERLRERACAGQPVTAGCAQAIADFCSTSENTFTSIKQTITSRINLWLNPRVRAATDASDFDLRSLRSQRMSIYLCASPDNLARVAPLYSLLFQQIIDLNTRERPGRGRHDIGVLVLLDEFARLGHAEMVAKAFAYVAGYGLRLLPVLQSPAQLRGQYGADLAEEIMSNCGVEVAFAPKELKVAQDLSERLGYYTYPSRSRSQPPLLSSGRRSFTESDQRRALMMPQELIQMPADQLIVLRAGMPPVRGRRIVYWREQAFRQRLAPPPRIPPAQSPKSGIEGLAPPITGPRPDCGPTAPPSMIAASDLTLEMIVPVLEAAGLEPLPRHGATDDTVEAWVDRFIDATAKIKRGAPDHGR